MKKVGQILSILFIQLLGNSGLANDNPVNDLRALVRDMELEHAVNVMQLMEWHDSLLVNKRAWQLSYDSLFSDTLALTLAERYLVEADAALLNYSVNPSLTSYLKLKAQLTSADIPFADSERYVRELLSILLEFAVDQNDYQLAYSLGNRLHAQYFNDWKASEELSAEQLDSLKRGMEELRSQGAQELSKMKDIAMQWHILAVVALVLLLVSVIVSIVLGKRWKRQRVSLSAKANDTSEEEVLVHKLEEAKREIIELKLLAKRKAEVVVPAVMVPDVPSGASISAADVAEWNDQVQQVLVKIKGHCEAGKGSMAVPTYMSIVNDATRLSAQVSKKSEQWIALLQSK
jgi:hypothetical protein